LIIFYLRQMLEPALLAVLLYFILLPLRLYSLRKKKKITTVGHEFLFAFFMMFLAGMVSLTQTPWSSDMQNGVNLIPFAVFRQTAYFLRHGIFSYLLINVIGNIVMFWPLGILPSVLWKNPRWWKALLLGFICSLSIELSQLRIQRGTDIDDLWLNALGALSGYWIYLLIRSAFPVVCSAAKIRDTKSSEE